MEKSLELVAGTRDRVIISDSSWFDNKDSLSLSFFHGLENSRMRERSAREYTFDLVFLGGKVFLVSSGLDSRAGRGGKPATPRSGTDGKTAAACIN